MKNNFLQEAYGGLREARSKHDCLGLPRQWKVITSTLLLLFTFAIGNVWADETYYLQDPAETNGTPALTGDFHTTASLNFTVNKAYDAVTYQKGLTFSSNINGSTSNMKKQDAWVRYDCQSTETDITILVYANSNSKKFYYWTIAENATIGSESACVVSSVSGVDATNGSIIKKDITISNETRTSLYVSVGATSNVSIVQIIATEKGTKFPKPGEAGYSINFNHGRYAAASGTLGKLDYTSATTGIEMHMSADYYYTQAINGSLKTNNTNYIKFAVPTQPVVLGFTTNNNKKYTVGAKGSTTNPITPTANAQKAIKITTTDALYINPQESSVQPTGMVFYIPTISYDKNDEGADGTMSSNTWTVVANGFTAPSGKKFDKWNTKADGSGDDVAVGDELLENTTLYAQWKADVAEYTVTYKDGESVLKSVSVACGNTPDAYTPTKDFYTFASWSTDPSTLGSTAANAEVELTASWTPNYAFGAYSFVNTATVGTAPAKTVTTSKVSYEAFRIDNFYFSGMDITYEAGASTTLADYCGWKINTKDATIKFLVENNCQVKVAIGRDNTAAVSYTALNGTAMNNVEQAKSTEIAYSVKAGTIFTISMTTGNTITLKGISISPLYNVTYVDETGDGEDGGNPENVTEVTLPTPSETTVGSYSFTGWVANQTVKETKVGGVEKTAGAVLTAGETYQLYATTTFTAQWALIADFDVKFFQGYGDPDVQIGETQSISTGGHAVAPADPTRTGFAFLGWSYDATEAHIVNVAAYAISAETNFTAMWKAVWTVTFDGAGNVIVEDGEAVASPDSPTQAGKVFQGWYNGENKYDFSAVVTEDLALTSKWADADANHYVYAYNDDFHYDGVVYKTPEGKVDAGNGTSNIPMTTPYTLFAGAEGITSIVMTDGIYDSKAGAIQAVTSHLKVNNNATSKLTITIKAGYTATLKIKAAGYSASRTMNVSDATPASLATPTDAKIVTNNAMTLATLEWQTFALASGSHDLTVTGGTLYISELDVEAEALPTFTVTYKAGEGTGDDVEDTDATEVADVPGTFTAPEGKIFNGWKDGDNNDVEVGTIVTGDMTLTAQWINHYAVTFNMNDHGDAPTAQDIKHGGKVAKPADPIAIGFDFGGWFTDEECTAGNEFDFNTSITAATPLYAKWTAFDGCTLLVPATSGDALIVGATVDLQSGSTGATIKVANLNGEKSIDYNAYGLSFGGGGKDSVRVTLNNDLQVGSVITVRLVSNGTTHENGRGLNLFNAAHVKKALLGWQAAEEVAKYDELSFSYTVTETDGFAGTNIIGLSRQNSVFLKWLKVTNCGSAVVYHNLTSAITPDHDPAYATVTLGATSVREGYTTTAEYSAIDPAYEFVSWSISGAGASIADATANPATITMGTEDAVVTLNLQLIPVKFTVNYFDGTTAMGTEQVVVNEHPTASEIKTAKRGYIFEGWAMSSTATASDVVALNTITSDVAATINLYAVYSEFPCPTSGNLFTWVIDPDADEIVYNVVKNVETEMVTAADVMTITGGTVAVGTTSSSATFTIVDGAFKFRENGNNYTRIELNCALQVGDVISYTSDNSANRYMSIYKDDMSGTAVTTAVDGTRKYFVASTESPIYGAYVLYIKGSNSDCSFKTLSIDRLAPATGVSLENATIAIGNTVTPTMTLLPSNDAYYESIAWSIVGEGEGTIANIDAGTGAVTALAAGSVTVQVKLNNDESLKATCTVEVISSFDQVDVTESTVWDMNNVSANAIELTGDDKNARLLLANIDGVNNNSSFNSQALMFEGQHIGRTSDGVKHLAGRYVQFNVTKQGVVSVIFASNGDNQRTIRINDKKCTKTTNSGTYITYDVLVQPGSVEIVGMEGASDNQYIRISKITYTVKETPDYSRTEMLGNGVLGTICLQNNVPAGAATGATFYELDGKDANGKMVFAEVDELVAGVPYVFEAHGDRIDCFYGETHVDDPEENTGALKGTFTGITFAVGEADNIYFFRDHALWSAKETGVQILANRAWMDMSVSVPNHAPKPGKRYISMGVQGQNAATGMDELNASETPVKMLIDGQLFILRGEKMYNANGQLVK